MRIRIHSLSVNIRPHPSSSSFDGKLDLAQPISFYCLELSEKWLLVAPNIDVVILVGCCSPSSRVDNLYKILSTPGTIKPFWDYADIVFGYYVDSITECRKSNSVWDVYGTWLER